MDVKILTNPRDVLPFLPKIQQAADEHREALGFLPASVYEHSAIEGRLWVATTETGEALLGHLLFGGTYPDIKVIQLFVSPQHQRSGVGSHLIQELVMMGEQRQYIAITARVAADLPANVFWEKQHFRCSRQVLGGKTTHRTINIRVRYLQSPSLFDLSAAISPPAAEVAGYESSPTLWTPRYALDLNGVFDLLRHRRAYLAISSLLRAAFNHFIHVSLTAEIHNELSRHIPPENSQDPILELLHQLPVLPPVNTASLSPLIADLRSLVFPHRSRTRKGAAQDNSDLTHLALCVQQHLTGFITNERALLRRAIEVKRKYGLELLSPYYFLEPSFDSSKKPLAIQAQFLQSEVSLNELADSELVDARELLKILNVGEKEAQSALDPGTSGNLRKRIGIHADGRVVGLASWNIPPKFRPETKAFFYLDEGSAPSDRIIDHVIELMTRAASTIGTYGIYLHHGTGQTLTRTTALSRGFRPRLGETEDSLVIFKLVVPGVIMKEQWNSFRADALKLSGLEIAGPLPSFPEVQISGVRARAPRTHSPMQIKVFDFETLISPGFVLFPGRSGIAIPIQKRFAEDLLGRYGRQTTLLPAGEALMRLERAYFRKPIRTSLFEKGVPVVFYASGHGPNAGIAVGTARVTSTAVLPVEEVTIRYQRQGVLPEDKLRGCANRHGQVHVFTFDNLLLFSNQMSFRRMQQLGTIGAANLVTAQELTPEQLEAVLREGFSGEEGH